MQQKFGCTRSGAHLTPTKNWGAHKAVHLRPKTRVDTQRRTLRLTIAVRSRGEVCPMPYALCPMPYALCPMPYALCPMPYALCPMHVGYLMLLRKAITVRIFMGLWLVLPSLFRRRQILLYPVLILIQLRLDRAKLPYFQA